MNKFLRLIGFILLLTLIFLFALGFNSNSQITIEQTHHFQAPTPLIWTYISDASKISEWNTQFTIKQCEVDTNGIIYCFTESSNKKIISIVNTQEDNHIFEMNLHESWLNPYINKYVLIVELKSLKDGTTELNCILQYELKNIMAKIANRIFFEQYQKKLLEKNIQSLHIYFEKV